MTFLSEVTTDKRPAAADGGVDQARGRARRRLIGAAVLLAVGVIVFPLLFETKPRPVVVDTPAVVPGKDSGSASTQAKIVDKSAAAAQASASAAKPAAATTTAATTTAATTTGATTTIAAAAQPTIITERAQDAGRERPPPPSAAEKAELDRIEKEKAARAEKERADKDRIERERSDKTKAERQAKVDAERQAKAQTDRQAKADEAKRARAALEGRAAPATIKSSTAPAAADAARYAIQVGAFASESSVRDARSKLERVGLKSYTQVVKSAAGTSSTRVRAGPYASRDEADKAADKARSIGFAPSVVPLAR